MLNDSQDHFIFGIRRSKVNFLSRKFTYNVYISSFCLFVKVINNFCVQVIRKWRPSFCERFFFFARDSEDSYLAPFVITDERKKPELVNTRLYKR